MAHVVHNTSHISVETHKKTKTFVPVLLVLLATFHLSPFTPASAQQPWNPVTVADACLDDVFLIEPPADLKAKLPQAIAYNTSYHVSGPYSKRGNTYVSFRNDDCEVLVPELLVEELLPHMVSHRYWLQRYIRLQEWTFVSTENLGGLLEVDTTDQRYGPYSILSWHGYTFQPSEEVPVVFNVFTNTHEPQSLSLRAIERLAEWGIFATDAQQYAFEQQQQSLNESAILWQQLLQQELDSLSNIGFIAGQQADSIHLAMQGDSIEFVQEQMRAEVERTKERMNANEIFLMNIKPARSDYMFGLEFNFYNCFDKTISKVEITVVPVNDRDQVQPDKFNRTTRSVRCMGPIHPGSPAQYLFDELFWNDNGRIKFMRVTNITFHFTDGSTRSFNGYNTILKHTLK